MSIKLNSSGGGSIDIQAPTTASNLTATLPARTGNIAMDGPAFRAYATGATSLTTAWSKVAFAGELFDTANAYDSVTNFRFQPAVAGYYQINGGINTGGTTSQMRAAIYKNGTFYSYGSQGVLAASTVSDVVYLNGSSDYVELWGYSATTANNAQFDQGNNFFSGVLVRAA